jgi:hypothetical protein
LLSLALFWGSDEPSASAFFLSSPCWVALSNAGRKNKRRTHEPKQKSSKMKQNKETGHDEGRVGERYLSWVMENQTLESWCRKPLFVALIHSIYNG